MRKRRALGSGREDCARRAAAVSGPPPAISTTQKRDSASAAPSMPSFSDSRRGTIMSIRITATRVLGREGPQLRVSATGRHAADAAAGHKKKRLHALSDP